MTMIRLIVDSFNCVPSFESLDECNADDKNLDSQIGGKEGWSKKKKLERDRISEKKKTGGRWR